MDEKMITPQYVYVDANGKIMGITSADAGVEVITEINLSRALTGDGIPRYKWDGTQAVERTEEELEADRANIPKLAPTQLDRVEAQVTYTAMVTDTLLEE